MSTSSLLRRSLLTSSRLRQPFYRPRAARFLHPQVPQLRFFAMSTPSEPEGLSAPSVVHNILNDNDFQKFVKNTENHNQDRLVVLDAFATWCGPCKVVAPQMVSYAKAYPEVRFYKFDVDELPEIAQSLNIRAMPTFLFFKNGKEVKQVVGANPKVLEAAIQEFSAAQ